MKCHAKGCANQIPQSELAIVCDPCLKEMGRIIKEMITERTGRPATDRDVEDCFTRALSRRPH
jgi:hypothetical protein